MTNRWLATAALVLGSHAWAPSLGSAWAQEPGPAGGGGAQTPPAQAQPPAASKLSVGDPAPPIRVAAWVKGAPVERFEPGVTHVVYFWATWCEHCRKAAPMLAELRKRHGDKLRVLAVSVWEDSDAQPRVKAAADRLGDDADYPVAFGGEAGEMERSWLDAAGLDSIPSVFLVDGEGRIAWIGNPLQPPGEMDAVADKLVAGEYDVAEAAARARRAAEIAERARPVVEEFRAAGRARDWPKAVELADRLIELDPVQFGGLAQWKFRTMIAEMGDAAGAYAFIRPLADGLLKDNAEALNSIAWTILDESGLEPRDVDLALRLAERAAELTEQRNGLILDTLALATFQKGEIARAIEIQERAIGLVRDVEMRAELNQRLEMFRKARGG